MKVNKTKLYATLSQIPFNIKNSKAILHLEISNYAQIYLSIVSQHRKKIPNRLHSENSQSKTYNNMQKYIIVTYITTSLLLNNMRNISLWTATNIQAVGNSIQTFT